MGGQGFRVDPESLALLSDLVKRQGRAAEVCVELELPEDDLRSEAHEGSCSPSGLWWIGGRNWGG